MNLKNRKLAVANPRNRRSWAKLVSGKPRSGLRFGASVGQTRVPCFPCREITGVRAGHLGYNAPSRGPSLADCSQGVD
jgi:hypothetical protein